MGASHGCSIPSASSWMLAPGPLVAARDPAVEDTSHMMNQASMLNRLLPVSLLVVALCSSADALVLCAARDGSVKVREACKPRERRIDTAAMGLQGPPGSRGPQGERGLSGLAGTQGES